MNRLSTLFRERNAVAIGIALAFLVLGAYLPSLQNGFVNLDDPLYVTNNPHVQKGLTGEGLRYAFTTFERGFWHPVTWLSLMLDRELFGPGARGFHFTSLLFHAANTMLLFVLLRRLTGATWQSAMVAALFGLHPLHVESVAWVSERKDVLSGFFLMLTLLAYAKYLSSVGCQVSRGKPASNLNPSQPSDAPTRPLSPSPTFYYSLSLVFFTLGLMSKTMLVTLPLILLLLDWWPLSRFGLNRENWKLNNFLPLLREKLPFFALALLAGLATLFAQREAGAIEDSSHIPIPARLANASLSYVRYLIQTVWPVNLAAYYSYPKGFSTVAVGIAVALGLAACLGAWRAAARRPYITFGWIWYVLTLLPVIGLLQVGSQSQADRYTYVPLVGIFVLVVWAVSELTSAWRDRVAILSGVSASSLLICIVLTLHQIGYWKDGEALFKHALSVTRENSLAQNNLGTALFDKGRIDEAMIHFQEAVRLGPGNPSARQNLGAALFRKGRIDEAIPQFQEAVRLSPTFAGAHCNLGAAFGMKGRVDDAIQQFQIALQLKPDYREAQNYLRFALSQKAAAEKKVEAKDHKSEKRKEMKVRNGATKPSC